MLPTSALIDQASTASHHLGPPMAQGRLLAAGPVATLVPSVPFTRALHLGVGQQRRNLFGDALIPRLPRDSAKVLVRESGTEHLRVFDTELGFEEPYKSAQFKEASRQFEMALYGFKYCISRDLVRFFADEIFDLTLGAAMRAEWAIRMDQENRLALLFGTLTNYPVANRLDATGAEWNATPGDSKTDIRIIENAIFQAHPTFTRLDLKMQLTIRAWEAAQEDPTFAAARGGINFATPDLADFERYLGYRPGSITQADTNVVVDGVLQSMWGETVIITVDPGSPDVINPFGANVFGLLHDMGVANAYVPWFEDDIRSDCYPVTTLTLPVGHDLSLGGIITNVKL